METMDPAAGGARSRDTGSTAHAWHLHRRGRPHPLNRAGRTRRPGPSPRSHPLVRRAAVWATATVFLASAGLLAQSTSEVAARPPAHTVPGCWIRGDPGDLELRISPLDSTSVALGGDTVKVCYSRPRRLGRPIMGRLVPYGDPWRLGANEATAIHLPFRASVAGVPLEAGSYSLYAVPHEETWRIVVNGNPRRWGIPIDQEVREADLGAGTVPVERLAAPVDMLTIRLVPVSDTRARLRIEWERTAVSVPLRRGRADPDGG